MEVTSRSSEPGGRVSRFWNHAGEDIGMMTFQVSMLKVLEPVFIGLAMR